ncbi:lytic murein transglycosylase [Rhodococcus sp. HNM0569]|uniref:lytic transglycosylase domain-containing protein n=1 Tax=Rhodococcus sp. HNM0569 TaxID=2716340 RepID=UPI00146EE82B|nr:lytic murein transglycosylase [Rhodococcus sp. HNM0569]NLU81613.1 murein transglycosylase [Rhodococcus sp. HNM0569]
MRPPPRARAVRALAAAAVACATALAGCSFDPTPRPHIPDGVPPGPGAPTPLIDLDAPLRSADQLAGWAAERSDELSIGTTALEAYGYAAAVLARSRPGCGIGWTTLAGIGSVESRHGTHGGSSVAPEGLVSPPIRGVPLDGTPGVAEIPDTDGGAMDGDIEFDRAMGPMQFIPETWRQWGVDANGDGIADPDSIDDATLTAALYLCERGGDLTTADGWYSALMAYNLSGSYLRLVRDRAAAYSVGVAP